MHILHYTESQQQVSVSLRSTVHGADLICHRCYSLMQLRTVKQLKSLITGTCFVTSPTLTISYQEYSVHWNVRHGKKNVLQGFQQRFIISDADIVFL